MVFWRCFWASGQCQLAWAEWSTLLLLGLTKTPQKFIMSNKNDVRCVYRWIFPWSPSSPVLSEQNFVSLVLEHWLLILVFSLSRQFFSCALRGRWRQPWSRVAVVVGWEILYDFSNSTNSAFGVHYHYIHLVKTFPVVSARFRNQACLFLIHLEACSDSGDVVEV